MKKTLNLLLGLFLCLAMSTVVSAQCTSYAGGPYNAVQVAPCNGGTISAPYDAWGNESYVSDVVAGGNYTFDICTGATGPYSATAWGADAELTIIEGGTAAAGSVTGGTVLASAIGCSVDFTPTVDGTVFIIISISGDCGGAELQVDNGTPTITANSGVPCGTCGDTVCDAGEVYPTCPECPCTTDPTWVASDGAGGFVGSPTPYAFCEIDVTGNLNPDPAVIYLSIAVFGDATPSSTGSVYAVSTTVGTIYSSEATPVVIDSIPTGIIAYIGLTQAEIDASFDFINVTFSGDNGACTSSLAAVFSTDLTDSADISLLCPAVNNCDNGTCDDADGESYCNCPGDCSCSIVGEYITYQPDPTTGQITAYLSNSGAYAYCESFFTGNPNPTPNNIYVPIGVNGVECETYDVVASEGNLFVFDGVAGTFVPGTTVGNLSIGWLQVTQADIDASGGMTTLDITDTATGTNCVTQMTIDWTAVNLFDGTVDDTCPCYSAGPYSDLGGIMPNGLAPCGADCGTPFTVTAFEVYSSEAYTFYGVIAGNTYEVDICTGAGAGAWAPNIVIESPTGVEEATSAGACTVTFTAAETGDYLIIIYEDGSGCGSASNGVDGGNLTVQCTGAAVCPSLLDVTVFLEGAFAPDSMMASMDTLRNPVLPLEQPFWYYFGTEALDFMYVDIVDWVLVELWVDGIMVDAKAALLLPSGMVIDAVALTPLMNFNVPNGMYDVVIRHQNHVDIVAPDVMIPGSLNCTDAANVLDGMNQMTALTSGDGTMVYAMRAGDANADGVVTSADFNFYSTGITLSGYDPADYNMDTNVEEGDWMLYKGNANHIGVDLIRGLIQGGE